MPNMVADGLLSEAIYLHTVALNPTTGDLALQNAVQTAINNAALAGLFTVAINVAAYNNGLIQLLIPKLINMGYGASLTAATTLTVTW